MILITMTNSTVDILSTPCMTLPVATNMNHLIKIDIPKQFKTKVTEFNEFHVLVILIKNLFNFHQPIFETLNVS
jgi:hypothetical protein